MHRASLRARRRASLDSDERGFTIIETVIAITVIFASLTAMAYTATAGFTTIAYGRERIQATGLANRIMEEVRGQAYVKITQGIKSTELTSPADARIRFCPGDGSYHFESCTSSNGSGEKLVSTSGLATTPWLVPHKGTTTVGTLSASWAVYITNDNPASNPYRVTVIVDWVSRARPSAPNNTVRIQSLFWSPSGCVSSDTHPFAAPCQPFFYGRASVPQARITIDGQFHNRLHNTWTQSVLKLTGAEASLQQEQVSVLQSTYTQSGVTMTDASGTEVKGSTTTTAAAADSDPAGSSPPYASKPGSGLDDTIAAFSSDSTGTTNQIGLTVFTATGDSALADAAVKASSSTSTCPSASAAPGELDTLPCAGSRIQQGGTATATSRFSHVIGPPEPGLGSATIVSVAAAANNPNKALVDREAVSGDGRVDITATRRLGTINIGGLPSGMTPPAGWAGASPYGGYCVTLDAYADTTTAQAGTSTTSAPTSTIDSGRIYYYNGSSFTPKPTLTDTGLSVNCTKSQTINGKLVVWTVSVSPDGFTPASTAISSTPTCTSPCTRTDAEASVTPPSIVVQYKVTVDNIPEIDYTITLDLGVNRSRGVYSPPPLSG